MVRNDAGQLYTIEGLAAALIMVITAYMVVNATSVYTAGDTHISDMQLETMGSDALTVMGSSLNSTENKNGTSILRSILEDPGGMNNNFHKNFTELVNSSGAGPKRDLQYVANYTCSKDGKTPLQPLSNTAHSLTGTEHPVRVTKWVIADTICKDEVSTDKRLRAVLVEVLLWLD